MPFTIACSSCKRNLRIPEQLLGQRVKCPSCGWTFIATERAPEMLPVAANPDEADPDDADLDEPRPRRRREEEHWDDDYRPAPRYRPRTLPGKGITVAVVILLGIGIVVDLVSLAFLSVYLLTREDKPAAVAAPRQIPPPAGRPGAVPAAKDDDDDDDGDPGLLLANSPGCCQAIIYLATAVVFCFWIYRAYANLKLFDVRGLEYSPGWAVGWFFIPFMNLVRPCQVAQEMWRASDPAVPLDEPRGWKRSSNSAVIGCWWAAWIINNIVSQIAMRANFSDKLDTKTTTIINIFADILSIPASAFAILMIKQLWNRQTAKYRLVCGGENGEEI